MQYTVKAAARATGVGESRLRTWERRYGIPKPARSSTGRRLYEDDDLRVIRRMAALVEAGLPAAHAAEEARSEGTGQLVPESRAPAPPPHPAVATIVDAAGRFDEFTVRTALTEAVRALGWGAAFAEVLFPALHAAGDEWERGELTPAHEHFLADLIRSQIAAAVAVAPQAPAAPLVLLACPEDERHELGLSAFSLLLRERGLRVCYLGGDVAPPHLLVAAERLRPAAVCLAATTSAALPSLRIAARAVLMSRIPLALFVGGPAIDALEFTLDVPGRRLPRDVGAAAALIAGQLAGAPGARPPGPSGAFGRPGG